MQAVPQCGMNRHGACVSVNVNWQDKVRTGVRRSGPAVVGDILLNLVRDAWLRSGVGDDCRARGSGVGDPRQGLQAPVQVKAASMVTHAIA